MAFTYQAPDGSTMTVNVKVFGAHDVTVQLRTLNKKYKLDEVLAMVYPVVDAEEKALCLKQLKDQSNNRRKKI